MLRGANTTSLAQPSSRNNGQERAHRRARVIRDRLQSRPRWKVSCGISNYKESYPLSSSRVCRLAIRTRRSLGSPASSPPPLPRFDLSLAFVAGSQSVNGGSTHSRESSVWTAPSPSRTRRLSSPRLPPLQSFPGESAKYSAPASPSAHHRTDSSLYYTAAWGSPYQRPSGSKGGRRVRSHHWTVSSDLSDGSPLRRSELTRARPPVLIHYEDQTPAQSGIGSTSYGLEPRDRTVTFAPVEPQRSGPARGFTEDWVRQYLSGQSNSERGNWWSDESTGSRSDSPTLESADRQYGTDIPWYGFESQEGGEGLKTPTLSAFVKSRDNARSRSARQGQKVQLHQPKESTDTIRPRGLQTFGTGTIEESGTSLNMFASKFADSPPGQEASVQPGNSSLDKPLPVPPSFERTISEAPVVNVAPRTPDLSNNDERPSHSSLGSLQRPKKRVLWRGKACIIALPADDTRGQEEGRPHLLTVAEIEERLRDWGSKGYDTTGFGLSSSGDSIYDGEAEGQSKTIYPDPGEILGDWEKRLYRVSIPDRREWEAYVEFLKEEKLRALGVSFGDDDISTSKSPVAAAMSRQSSRYPSLPLSPPVPGSSAASNHTTHHTNPFSPVFLPSTNASSQVGSLTSPGSQSAGYVHLPMPAQSIDSAFQYPRRQSTPPSQGIWSPQAYLGPQHAPRGGSPALASTYQNTGNVLAPGSLYGFESKQQIQERSGSKNTASTNHEHQQFNSHQQPHLSKVSEHRDGTEHETTYRSQPDIVNPIPRGHRHNLSETLQKEIDEAERHLEQSIRHQLEKDGHQSLNQLDPSHARVYLSPTSDEGSAIKTENSAEIVGELPPEGLSDPDANTRESALSEGRVAASDNRPSHPALDSNTLREPRISKTQPKHQTKPSMSKLNVEAKEFKFDPRTSFTPGNFTFANNNFASNPTVGLGLVPRQATKVNGRTSNHLFGAIGSNFNVAAPAFTPAYSNSAKFPTGNFNFSSSGPPFRPGAPSFTPGSGNRIFSRATDSEQSGSDNRGSATDKIFGNFNLADIVKPAKKSKAIAIIRPDDFRSGNGRDDEGQEDESGRITQADGRQKRLRRGESDGDQIPQFATPSHPLTEMIQTKTPHRESA